MSRPALPGAPNAVLQAGPCPTSRADEPSPSVRDLVACPGHHQALVELRQGPRVRGRHGAAHGGEYRPQRRRGHDVRMALVAGGSGGKVARAVHDRPLAGQALLKVRAAVGRRDGDAGVGRRGGADPGGVRRAVSTSARGTTTKPRLYVHCSRKACPPRQGKAFLGPSGQRCSILSLPARPQPRF